MSHRTHLPNPVVIVVLTALLVVGTVLAAPASTQEPGPITFGVVPSSATGPDGRSAFTFELGPGDVVEDHVGISNLSDGPLELAVYASDAITTPDGGFDLLPASDPPTDVGAWIGFATDTVVVPARSRLDIPFRLTIPAGATPGDHPGGIVASLRTAGRDGQVSVDRRVGARIYLRVAGDLAPGLDVTDAHVSYDSTAHPLRAGTVTVTYTVTNTGNVRLAGAARLRVAGPFGLGARTVDLGDLPELLPGAVLIRTATVDGILPLVRVRATVAVEPRPVGDTPAPATASGAATTWALPLPQAGSLLLLGGLVCLWWRRRRDRERRHAAELAAARAVATPS